MNPHRICEQNVKRVNSNEEWLSTESSILISVKMFTQNLHVT